MSEILLFLNKTNQTIISMGESKKGLMLFYLYTLRPFSLSPPRYHVCKYQLITHRRAIRNGHSPLSLWKQNSDCLNATPYTKHTPYYQNCWIKEMDKWRVSLSIEMLKLGYGCCFQCIALPKKCMGQLEIVSKSLYQILCTQCLY